jgi:RNA polymerase sigma-70 factor (ECF subfamily)
MRSELQDQLLSAMAELPQDDQWLLYLFYRHSRTRGEIAAELGVTEKSVETRLYRARGRLRELLSEQAKAS